MVNPMKSVIHADIRGAVVDVFLDVLKTVTLANSNGTGDASLLMSTNIMQSIKYEFRELVWLELIAVLCLFRISL